jgi:hypothetical protein
VGTPSDSDLTLSSGAGHGEKGDALNLGPAQERLAPLPAQPKPTNAEKPANPENVTSDDEPSTVIALKARTRKAEAAEVTAVVAEAVGLATAHPKPAKRKNARERAKDKYAKNNAKNSAKNSAKDRTTPTMTAKAKSKAEKKADTKAKKSKAA